MRGRSTTSRLQAVQLRKTSWVINLLRQVYIELVLVVLFSCSFKWHLKNQTSAGSKPQLCCHFRLRLRVASDGIRILNVLPLRNVARVALRSQTTFPPEKVGIWMANLPDRPSSSSIVIKPAGLNKPEVLIFNLWNQPSQLQCVPLAKAKSKQWSTAVAVYQIISIGDSCLAFAKKMSCSSWGSKCHSFFQRRAYSLLAVLKLWPWPSLHLEVAAFCKDPWDEDGIFTYQIQWLDFYGELMDRYNMRTIVPWESVMGQTSPPTPWKFLLPRHVPWSIRWDFASAPWRPRPPLHHWWQLELGVPIFWRDFVEKKNQDEPMKPGGIFKF